MIIPKPNFYHENSGKFILKSPLKYNYSHELETGVKFFKEFMINYAKIDLEKEEYANVNFLLDFSLSEEQYKIIIKENTLDVYARCSKGAFYAIQSLKQIYNFQNQSFPCVEIDDEPRF
jgi:N-acetyl-beta-hexosaminidase